MNNTEHLTTVQHSAQKAWFLAAMWVSINTNHLPKHTFISRAPSQTAGTPWQHWSPGSIMSECLLPQLKHCRETTWRMRERADGVRPASECPRSEADWATRHPWSAAGLRGFALSVSWVKEHPQEHLRVSLYNRDAWTLGALPAAANSDPTPTSVLGDPNFRNKARNKLTNCDNDHRCNKTTLIHLTGWNGDRFPKEIIQQGSEHICILTLTVKIVLF